MKCVLAALGLAACFGVVLPASAADIVVAQTLDLSGLSNLGKDFSNGVRTYFDSVNARGGVRGRRISFVQLDDSGRAADAATNAEKLLQDNDVDAMIAPTSEETLLAVANAPRVRASGLLMVGAPTGADLERAGVAARVLPVRASYRDEARVLLDYLKTFSEGAVALVRGDGPDSEACALALREEARARGVVLTFDGTALQWQQRSPAAKPAIGALIVTGDALGVAPVLQQARKAAPTSTLLGFSTVDHRTLIEIAGAAAKGMMITQAVPPPGKTIHPFQREHRALMKQYRDEPPSQHTLEGYVVARLLVSALERVDGEPSASKVSAALRASPALEFGPMRVSGRGSGVANRYVDMTAISSKGGLVE
jgi:ABC-type branched-subunit amino acid transport system substrate-binding protein